MAAAAARRRAGSSSEVNCSKCQQTGGEEWICCEHCSNWHHVSCTSLPGEVFPFLKSENLLFICENCIEVSKQKLKGSYKVDKNVLESSILKCIEGSIKAILPGIIAANTPEINPVKVPEVTTKVNTDTLSRRTEIRMSGIPESDRNKGNDIEHDSKHVRDVLEKMNEYEPVNIESVKRLGQPSSNSTGTKRPRMILVQFRNEWTANKCLSKGYMLKDHPFPVFIAKSLSKSEIEIEKTVLKKRAELINSGIPRTDLRIRNLKLYQKGTEVPITTES